MKKILLLLAVASIAFAAFGCKGGGDESSSAAPAAGSKIKDKTPGTGDE